MWYYVYHQFTKDGKIVTSELGRTRYREDADRLIEGWHSGYISHRGEIVFSKNLLEA